MSAKLHVLLGAGGVGKTTLAAGYALALGRAGARVGVLGIDPSRRLQGALGIELPDVQVLVPNAGELRAALLRPEACMRRWAAETCADREEREKLLRNPFFLAVADRLATATDLLAAVRVAEWGERDPQLEDLVVDTAPGLDAIEFLRRPQRLTAFLEGRLVAWLRQLSTTSPQGALRDAVRGGARRVLGGLVRIGGTRMLRELADFVSLAQGLFSQMLARVERMQRWLASSETEILLVTAVRADATHGARQLVDALAGVGLAPTATVLNRAVTPELADELASLGSLPPDAAGLVRYARAYSEVQASVSETLRPLAPRLVHVEAKPGLDAPERVAALAALGERLRRALERR